jgi:hypothetical protein
MSYYANTLFPVVEGVFHQVRSADLPTTPKAAAEKIRAAGYPREAAVIEGMSEGDLQNVYRYSDLVNPERDAEDMAWEMAEEAWSGR